MLVESAEEARPFYGLPHCRAFQDDAPWRIAYDRAGSNFSLGSSLPLHLALPPKRRLSLMPTSRRSLLLMTSTVGSKSSFARGYTSLPRF